MLFASVTLSLNYRELALKTNSYYKTRNWVNTIQKVAEDCEYIRPTPHESFAPQRTELAHWLVLILHVLLNFKQWQRRTLLM